MVAKVICRLWGPQSITKIWKKWLGVLVVGGMGLWVIVMGQINLTKCTLHVVTTTCGPLGLFTTSRTQCWWNHWRVICDYWNSLVETQRVAGIASHKLVRQETSLHSHPFSKSVFRGLLDSCWDWVYPQSNHCCYHWRVIHLRFIFRPWPSLLVYSG